MGRNDYRTVQVVYALIFAFCHVIGIVFAFDLAELARDNNTSIAVVNPFEPVPADVKTTVGEFDLVIAAGDNCRTVPVVNSV